MCHNPWFHDLELLDQGLEAGPSVALSLATLVEPTVEEAQRLAKELLQAAEVATDAEVMVIAPQLGIQQCEQFFQAKMVVLLAPGLEVLQGASQALTRRASPHMRLSRPILIPAELEAQEVEGHRSWQLPTEGD